MIWQNPAYLNGTALREKLRLKLNSVLCLRTHLQGMAWILWTSWNQIKKQNNHQNIVQLLALNFDSSENGKTEIHVSARLRTNSAYDPDYKKGTKEIFTRRKKERRQGRKEAMKKQGRKEGQGYFDIKPACLLHLVQQLESPAISSHIPTYMYLKN